MNNKLSVLKNLIWALGILVCMAAVVVGLFISAANRYPGEQDTGRLAMDRPVKVDKPSGQTEMLNTPDLMTGNGQLNVLNETMDGGQAYIDMLTFLCDSSLIGLRDYGVLSGGIMTEQVWGTSAGNFPAPNIANGLIKYPADSSDLSPAAAAGLKKPEILVIALGMDSLDQTDEQSFIANYTKLVRDIHTASPDTTIVLCSLTSVTPSYTGTDNMTSGAALKASEWVQQVCITTGAKYADIADAVTESTGSLLNEYASSNGKTLNTAGVNKVLEYLRMHIV